MPQVSGSREVVFSLREKLRSAAGSAVVAQKNDGQGFFMAGDTTAMGNVAVLTPGLVKLPSAHLARSLVHPIEVITADYAYFSIEIIISHRS